MAPAFGHGRAAALPPRSLTGRSIRRAWLCRSGYGAACTTRRAQGRGLGAPRRGAFALRPHPSSARRRAPIRHAHRRRHCRAPAPATASFCRLPGGRSMDRTELACLPFFRRGNCDPYRPYLIATSPSQCAGIRGTKHLAYCRVVWHRARLPPIFHDAPSGPAMWRVSIRAWIARATRFCAWKTHGGAVNSENHLSGSRAAPAGGASWHRSRGVGVFRRPVGWPAITGRRVVSADDGAH